MELAWCHTIGLSASVAAYGVSENELSRVILEVEGHGAAVYLAMEQGFHRIRKSKSVERESESVSGRMAAAALF
jgi:microcompartment protein CcmL/EutN